METLTDESRGQVRREITSNTCQIRLTDLVPNVLKKTDSRHVRVCAALVPVWSLRQYAPDSARRAIFIHAIPQPRTNTPFLMKPGWDLSRASLENTIPRKRRSSTRACQETINIAARKYHGLANNKSRYFEIPTHEGNLEGRCTSTSVLYETIR